MSKSKRRLGYFSRSTRFESLEERIVLDTQIGTVTMPYTGYLSAGVYDSNGQLVRTLLAQASKSAGTVTLTWDGKDDLGRPVIDSGTYTWKALSSQLSIVDQGGVGDSAFNKDDLTQDMGYTVQNLAVNQLSGTHGDLGGTFAQNANAESYIGDTSLSQTFSLNTPITASGTLYFTDVANMQGKAFIGHFSKSHTGVNDSEFIGLEFERGGDSDHPLGVRARIYRYNDSYSLGQDPTTGIPDGVSNTIGLGFRTGYYSWDYSYDPNFENNSSHVGAEGALTVHIYNNAGATYTLTAINSSSHRDAGSTFDSFGMGIAKNESNADNSTITANIFVDDVSYSGHTGVVDFESSPGWTQVGNTIGGNAYGWNTYNNIDNSLFVGSLIEEGFESKKLNQSGTVIWNQKGSYLGIAADEKYVYSTRHVFVNANLPTFGVNKEHDPRDPNEPQEDRLYRYFSKDGYIAPFAPGVDYIVINSGANATDPRPTFTESGTGKVFYLDRDYAYTPFEFRTVQPTWGVAVDGNRVWVTDYRTNSVKIYDKLTGQPVKNNSAVVQELKSSTIVGTPGFNGPVGIAVQASTPTSGTIWVTYRSTAPSQSNYAGDTLTKFTYTVDGSGNYSFTRAVNLSGLSDPTGVTYGGPNNHIFVALSGTTKIREYDTSGTQITGAGSLAAIAGSGGEFGSKHLGGALGDSQFYWDYWGNEASIAIDSTGILSVNDDHRIQRFYSTTVGTHTPGELYQSIFSEYAPAPNQTKFPTGTGYDYSAGGKHYMLSNRYVYEVDAEYTGGPRVGWLGDGSWRLVARYYTPHGEENGSPGTIVKLNDGGTQRQYLYMKTSSGLAIYNIDSAQRLSTIIGDRWTGVSRMQVPNYIANIGLVIAGQFNWSDTDGDGVIDWNGVGSGSSDGEVSWYKPLGQTSDLRGLTSLWTDSSGTIWYVDNQNNIVKLPLQGFDAQHNPLYNWAAANKTVVVPYNPAGMGFAPIQVRVAGNGDIYALGDGRAVFGTYVGNGGGRWLAKFNSSGVLQWMQPIPVQGIYSSEYISLTLDETDSSPDFIYLGGIANGYIVSSDGLFVSQFAGGPSHGGPYWGWMDHPFSVDAFTNPLTGKAYFYGEEDFFGKSNRWRIDNLNTIHRPSEAGFSGTFSYSYTTGITGQWTFDNTLNDSVGGHNATVTTGTASYTTGKVGSAALSLNGSTSLDISYPTDFNGYAVSLWVKPNSAATNQVIVDRRSSSYAGTLGEIRINADGKFEHLLTVGGALKTITGSTIVQSGTWYHVAVTAKSDGVMHLYVNGVEEGTPINLVGNLWVEGDKFHVGGPEPSGGGSQAGGYFNGLVDDLQIYEHPLTQSEIVNIAGPAVYVKATDYLAAEAGTDPGVFTIYRTTTGNALVVNYTTNSATGVTGVATNGTDYSSLTGTVTIPSGSTSVNVTVTPIDDAVNDPSEVVSLTISSSANYLTGGNITDKVVIQDNEATGDIGWFGVGNYSNANSYGWSYNTNHAGGAATGEVGGTFAKNGAENYYGDIHLSQSFTLNDTLWASGTFSPWAVTNFDPGKFFVGHFSQATGSVQNEFIGMEVTDDFGAISVRARIFRYNGDPNSDAMSGYVGLTAGQAYHFDYSYDPTYENDPSHAGPEGRLMLHISGSGGFDTTVYAINDGSHRDAGSRFDAFGVGMVGNESGSTIDNTKTMQFFIDDVSYAGSTVINIVSVNATDAIASEPGSDTGVYTFTRANTGPAVVVSYTMSSTSAVNGTDYTSLNGTVTIPSGSTSVTLTLIPKDDTVAEGDETATLTISSSANYFLGSSPSATITIHDDEPTVSVSATDNSASEPGSDTGVYTFTRTNAGAALAVSYTMSSNSATNGTDYTSLNGTVTIPSGSSSVTLTLIPKDDALFEGDETAVLTLAAMSPATYFIDSVNNSGTVTIHDNEYSVSVSATDASASEPGSDTGVYTFTRNITGAALVVSYTMSSTSAVNGTDYTSLGGTVTIPSGSTAVTLTLIPKDDALAEGDETATLTISSSSSYFSSAPTNTATITIHDDEPTVSVSATDNSASEPTSDTGVYNFTRTNNGAALVVSYTMSGAAVNNTDYSSLSGTVTIPSGSSSVTLTIIPKDDSIAEGDELATLTLAPMSPATYFISSTNNAAAVTIHDDEPTVTITASDPDASEPGSSDKGVYTFTRTNAGAALVVLYTTNSGASGAATNGTDYSSLNGTVTIPSGSSSVTLTLTAIDDSVAEGDESVILSLAAVSPNPTYFIGTPDTATVTIHDDEPTVTVAASDPNASEPGSDVGVYTFTRSNSGATLVVSYTMSSNSAVNGTDYTSLNGTVTIPSGSSTITLTLIPKDDAIAEGDETAVLTISSSSAYFRGSPSSATVTIHDDDMAINSQAGGTFARNDNESYFGDINLSQSYTLNSTITASGTFTFSNADTMHGKFFVGHFSQSTADTRREFIGAEFVEGDVDGQVGVRARIYRYNGDAVSDAWSSAYANLNSASGPFTFSYTYDPSYDDPAQPSHAGPEGRLTLVVAGQTLYAINDGSHRDAGSTFDAFGMGIETMESMTGDDPNSTAKLFIDDVTYSGHTGTVNFNTDPGWAGVGNTSDGNSYGWNLINVVASDPNAAEQGADPGVFTISRGSTVGNLPVYYTIGGTAAGGTDYTALSGTVTIPNGSSSVNVSVLPINDNTPEPSETVVLSLSSNVNYTLKTPTSATVTIADSSIVTNSQAGGTFARNDNESYFGDINLSQSYTLNSTITASGTFTFSNADTMHGKFFVGHFSQSTADTRREFIGAEFVEGDVDGQVGVRARIYRYNGDAVSDAWSSAYANLNSASGPFTFSYTYDPSYDDPAQPSHAGPEGRLTLVVAGQTLYAINDGSHRDAGSTFDAFGMGIETMESMTGDDPNSTAKLFIDDVTYSGHTGTVNFNTDPGWAGVGNTSDGNSYGWVSNSGNTVSVTATDPSAAEQGQDPGVFTITRGTTSGDLVVYYTLGGTATNGSDYSSIAGSVTIPTGLATVNVTVVPINDTAPEAPETVTLLLSTNANYQLSTPSNATVTIADNDGYLASEAGGTFARNDNESYFGDTHLSQSYTLNNTITASGTFFFQDAETMHGKMFVGHFSSSTADNRREFMGAEFIEGDNDGQIGVRARIYRYNGDAVSDAWSSAYVNLAADSGSYHFDYTYDPNYENDGTHSGPEGRLALHIYNDALTVNSTLYAINDGSHRDAGSTFDSFGMGIETMESMTGDDPSSSTKMFIDNLQYSGHTGTVDFSADPGWTGVGNTTDGNSYGLTHQLAHDGFETATVSGGMGWGGNWSFTGSASIVNTGTPKTGTYHLLLTGNNGVASRAVNLAGATNAILSFDWKANSFESGETAVVEIYNGTAWVNVMTITQSQADNVYHHADISLSAYTMTSSFQVRFRSLMSAADDYFYVDNLTISA